MRFTFATTVGTFFVPAVAVPLLAERGIGMAIPITIASSFMRYDGSVDLDALDSHIASLSAKILDGFDNYERNTGMTHPAAMKRSETQKRSGAGINLTGYRRTMWYGTISIGTPAEEFTVRIDTGGSNLFLPAYRCDSSCDGHTRWDTSSSSTARPVNEPFATRFGDGSVVSGHLYTDNVTIAGFTADTQTIGAATKYSVKFHKDRYPADGSIGMAFHTLAPTKRYTWFETLVREKKVIVPVFSFKLGATGGELFVGGTNVDLYDGEITFTKVTKQAYWQVNLQKLEGRGKTFVSDVDAIIDTGASIIAGNPAKVRELHTELGGTAHPSRAGYYTFPCGSFPSISLSFGDKSFRVSSSTLSRGRLSPGSPDCISGIVGVNMGASFWVVGDVFLQNVYSVFDVGNLQVGFADLRRV